MCADHSTKPVEFRDIAGDPGYQIGSDGSVRSCWARGKYPRLGTAWRFLKPGVFGLSNHLGVRLKNRKSIYVHKLVLEAFVGPRPDGLECRHLDGDPTNNNLWNLAWGTQSENQQDSVRHGTCACLKRIGEKNNLAKLTEEKIRDIRIVYSQGILSQTEMGKKFGVHQGTISSIVLRKTWKHVE